MKKYTSPSVFLWLGSFLLLSLPLVSMEGGHEAHEWKKPELPESREKAEQMQKRSLEEKKQALAEKEAAEKSKKEADKEGNTERAKAANESIEEAKLEFAEARYAYQTGRLAKALLDNNKKEIDAAEKERKSIVTKIEQLQKDYQPAIDPKQLKPIVKRFNEDMQFDWDYAMKEDLPVDVFAVTTFFSAKSIQAGGLPDYESQQSALKSLQKFLDTKMTKNLTEKLSPGQQEKYGRLRTDLTQRLAEIDTFIKEPPERLEGNSLAQKLQLEKRIPEDQLNVLAKELPSIMDDLPSLQQALGALAHYKLTGKRVELTKEINERINALSREREPEISKGMQQAEEKEKLISETFRDSEKLEKKLTVEGEGGQGTEESISEEVSWVSKMLAAGLNKAKKVGALWAVDALGAIGEEAGAGRKKAEAYARGMEKVPDIVDRGIGEVKKINKFLKKIRPYVEWIPVESVRNLAIKLKKGESYLKIAEDSEANLAEYAKKVSALGPVARAVAGGLRLAERGAKAAANFVRAYAKEEIKADPQADKLKMDFDRASAVIEQEREFRKKSKATQEQQSKYAAAFEPVLDFAKKIAKWLEEGFKDPLKGAKPTFAKAKENYELAREKYLTTIGFTKDEIAQNLNPEKIQKKLGDFLTQIKNDKTKRMLLQKATQNLAHKTTELATAYDEFFGQLESAKINYEFLVAGWDHFVAKDVPKNVVELVNHVTDLRDTRDAYLQAARNGADLLKQEVKELTKDTDFEDAGYQFGRRVSEMVSNEKAKLLKEYDAVLGAIEKSINQERQNLEQFTTEKKGGE